MIDAEKTIDILKHCIDEKHGCYGCPKRYTNGRVACKEFEQGYNTIPKSVVRDAIALLKEQEPRVLNWDEVGNYSVVYGEFRGVKEIFPLIVTKDMSGRILSWNPGINRSGEHLLLVSDEEDRRNTRCWNREPTDEQREAVTWE